MVIVTCLLKRAVRRCDPTTVTEYEREQLVREMKGFMQRICGLSRGDLRVRAADECPGQQKPFEDLTLIIKFELQSSQRSQAKAVESLLVAYRSELKNYRDEFYWLTVGSLPVDNEDMNLAAYHEIKLKNFLLGFMSSAVDYNTHFNYEKDLYPYSHQFPKTTLEIDRGKIIVDFAVSNCVGLQFYRYSPGTISPTTEIYRLEIDFQDLSYYVLVHQTTGVVDLCFLATKPLQLWRTQFRCTNLAEINYDKTNWIRTCKIVSSETRSCYKLDRHILGGCNALILRLTDDANTKPVIDSLREYGRFQLCHTFINYLPSDDYGKAPCAPLTGTEGDLINWLLAAIHSIGYRVQHQLSYAAAFHVSGFRKRYQYDVIREFTEQVRHYSTGSRDDRRHLENALSKSFDVLLTDSQDFLHIDRVLLHFLNGPRELDELTLTGNRLVKRLVITPSRVLFMAPALMHDNRILREFDPDSAVVCSFYNDDMSGFASVANSMEFVEEAIGKVLREGVRVASSHFEFLGCSSSGLRQNGCWLYSEDENGKSAADIRKWMGDLDEIRNVGTYLARMGQCFSDTTAAELDTDIDINWQDEDIEGGCDPMGKPYCFSDGVGRISLECLNEVFMKLEDAHRPSAFQVRLGGSKGMLTLDPSLTGKTIMVRKSMFKFKSSHRTIEVMRRTKPTPLFLNRQIITLLSQLHDGIKSYVFIRMLNNMLHRFADIMLDDNEAKMALSQSGFSCCYGKLYKAGLSFTTDPFFKGVLKAITCARINGVKHKARIEVPAEYGRAMLGVMDEVGVLNYGEVFVQYSADMEKPLKDVIVHEGDVVVSKMPCLHPGDVRKFQAVNRPELRHLVDCIVFPRKGSRPHPNEMAGSDLDGDEYFVTWLPDLIFRGPNHPPMDFPSYKKEQLYRPITVNDMVDFLVTYIVNDKIGQISNAHLAWADKESIHTNTCTNLARIFCHVIDFNKTGYLPPEVTGKNITSLLPKKYPDFMGKQDHMHTYASKKILGQLFRISKRVEAAVTTIDQDDNEKINNRTNWKMDVRFLIDGYEAFLPAAQTLYTLYEDLLDAEQRRYGIESEEELVSGYVIKMKGYFTRDKDISDIEKRLRLRLNDIRKFIVGKFDEYVDTNEVGVRECKAKRKQLLAAACYNLTYSETKKHRSFPWIFADYLVEVLQNSKNKLRDSPEPPLVSLTRSIDEISMADVRSFYRNKNERVPQKEILARVYFVLINWGMKCKCVLERISYRDTLSIRQCIMILDRIVADDAEVNTCLEKSNSGALLLAIFRAITNVNENLIFGKVESIRAAIIDLKRSVLIGHHQVARDPRVQCLLVQQQTIINRTLMVEKSRWDSIKREVGALKKRFKQTYNVKADFRRTRNGGLIYINGLQQDVDDFSEAWLDETKNVTHILHSYSYLDFELDGLLLDPDYVDNYEDVMDMY